MTIFSKIKPKFWDHTDVAAGPYKHLFNFRRIWQLVIFLMVFVTLAPLVTITLIDYNVTQDSMRAAVLHRASRFVSNTWRTVSFFLSERKAALNFIIKDHTLEDLKNPDVLESIFSNLKKVIGAYSDLGVIDPSGVQTTYVGPYDLAGKNYSGQDWFKQVVEEGIYVSDVFMGFRMVPHLVIAVKQMAPDGSFFVLRASLDTKAITELLSQLDATLTGDVFIINHLGVLQTSSRFHGSVLEELDLLVPERAATTRVFEYSKNDRERLIIGYHYIPETPFILMVVQRMKELMAPWQESRIELLGFLAASITVILIVILGVATYLVNKIYMSDQKRVAALHHVEYTNKMASIGRLAAGVAHEINNPLAIINEKAGLIKDLFTYQKQYADDPKLNSIVDSIIYSVERCSKITKRLLSFSRHSDSELQAVNLKDVICEVLDFQHKEAEYRSISVNIDVPEDVPTILSVHGKLQEIFLNLVNNAFAALHDGGRLDVTVRQQEGNPEYVSVDVSDNGHGIPEKDLNRIFEPFFSTKADSGGTGLGLSITRGLVEELGGCINVKSQVGVGTCFTIALPLKAPIEGGIQYEGTTRR